MSTEYTLPSGKKIDLKQYEIFLFMQHGCPFCQRFNPKLQQFIQQTETPLAVFTLNGEGDETFPNAKPAPEELVNTLFVGIEVATPTTFLISRANNTAELLSQGDLSIDEFKKLFDESLQNMEDRHS